MWRGHLARDQRALVSRAAFQPDAAYPEDGANITLFAQDTPDALRRTESAAQVRSP